jgi:hypothetical protein
MEVTDGRSRGACRPHFPVTDAARRGG